MRFFFHYKWSTEISLKWKLEGLPHHRNRIFNLSKQFSLFFKHYIWIADCCCGCCLSKCKNVPLLKCLKYLEYLNTVIFVCIFRSFISLKFHNLHLPLCLSEYASHSAPAALSLTPSLFVPLKIHSNLLNRICEFMLMSVWVWSISLSLSFFLSVCLSLVK